VPAANECRNSVTGVPAPFGPSRHPDEGDTRESVSDLGDISFETYGDLLREAITDLLEPRDMARK
jgi:hypothetical protein